MNIYSYFLLFLFYSFVGWIIEIINEIIRERRFVNRGFLIGPYCPIYGCGMLLIIFLLTRYLDEPVVLFVMCVILCSILEYFTSYIMEKMFKARWWDYSDRKFNINGRICLETLIPFGVGGLLIMYLVNPFMVSQITSIPSSILKAISIILFILFMIDNFISFKIIFGFRKTTKKAQKDDTVEITAFVKEILTNKSKLNKRLIKSFPGLKVKYKKKKVKK